MKEKYRRVIVKRKCEESDSQFQGKIPLLSKDYSVDKDAISRTNFIKEQENFLR